MTERERLWENIALVRREVEGAGRMWRHSVTLCAVTKTVDPDRINLCYDAGVRVIGENRVQEAMGKFSSLNPDFALHIIGQLQTNKVKYVVEFARMVQSLDRMDLAKEIHRRALGKGRAMPVLAQVNIAREQRKAGLDETEAEDFLRECADLPGLRVEGLMAILPLVSDPEEVRPYFRRMRGLFDRIREARVPGIRMEHLSMGMSGDYRVAAQEGATMVRVGSLIFGEKETNPRA